MPFRVLVPKPLTKRLLLRKKERKEETDGRRQRERKERREEERKKDFWAKASGGEPMAHGPPWVFVISESSKRFTWQGGPTGLETILWRC